MKFTSYQNRAQLGAPASQVSNVHYSNPGALAAAKAEGELYTTIGKGITTYADTVSKTKALEANNYYNQRMSQETADLMQDHKEGEALNITELYDQKQKQVMDETQKKYGNYLKFGAGAQAFTEFTMRDNATRRANMQRYQMGETEKYEETQYLNNVQESYNMLSAGGYSKESVDGCMNRISALTANRFEAYGAERVKAETFKYQNAAAKQAVDNSLAKGDWDAASVNVLGLGNYLTSDQKNAYLKTILEKKRAVSSLNKGRQLYEKYGNDLASAKRAIEGGQTFNGDEAMKYANQASNAVYGLSASDKYNEMDCGFFTQCFAEAGGFTLNSRAADDQLYQMEQEGRFTKNVDEAGDYALVFWSGTSDRWKYTDDPNGGPDTAYKGVTHVGILLPNGKVLQMGSSGLTEIDKDTYDIVGYGRMNGREYTPEEQKSILSSYKQEVADDKWQRTQNKENMMKDFYAQLVENGEGKTTAQLKEWGLSMTGDDVDAISAFNGALSLYTSGRGSANGKGATRRTTAEIDSFIEENLRNRTIGDSAELMETLDNIGITNETDKRKYLKMLKDSKELKGLFKYDFNDLLKEAIDDDSLKGAALEKAKANAIAAGKAYVSKYMYEHNGETPDRYDVIGAIQEAMVVKNYGSAQKPTDWIFDSPVGWSRAEVLAAGYSDIQPAGDGAWYATKKDTGEDIYMTSQEVMKALGKEGW